MILKYSTQYGAYGAIEIRVGTGRYLFDAMNGHIGAMPYCEL